MDAIFRDIPSTLKKILSENALTGHSVCYLATWLGQDFFSRHLLIDGKPTSASLRVCVSVSSFPWRSTEEAKCLMKTVAGSVGHMAGKLLLSHSHSGEFRHLGFHAIFWPLRFAAPPHEAHSALLLRLFSVTLLSNCSLEPMNIFSLGKCSPSYSYYFEAWHQHA